MTLKHVLKYFSKTSEDLGAKGFFAIAQDDEESVIQRAKPEESQAHEVLRYAQDDGRFSGEGCKVLPSPVAFATQSPKCRKTRHFDKMLKQVQHDNFSCAKHTEKDLPSKRLTVLTTLKKCAFTLAEVLITLGIIGVVAAMTLPTLIQNHQKQTYVTGLKKAYANLQNAFAKMAYDEGVTDWRQTSCASMGLADCSGQSAVITLDKKDICLENLKNQLNIASYSENDLSNPETYFGSLATFKTVDGMIYTLKYDFTTVIEIGYILGLKSIEVDVNGNKGPNKMGRDQFYFDLDYSKNKVSFDSGLKIGYEYPSTGPNYILYCTTANVNSNDWKARYCTAKVLIEGKMDY